ncbi:MAG: YceI family protein [Longimicrobiales bacterium]
MTSTFRGLTLAAAALSVAAAPAAAPMDWVIDEAHTTVGFSVKHFFTPVDGQFDDFEIDLQYDAETPSASAVSARIAVASVNTNNEDRDAHLMSADFFEAEAHPTITFQSTSVRAEGADRLVATGDLTIKGITREVEMPITLLGIQDIPADMREMLGGAERIASFEAGLSIDRGDFDVGTGSWAATLVVGGQVDIDIAVEAHLR